MIINKQFCLIIWNHTDLEKKYCTSSLSIYVYDYFNNGLYLHRQFFGTSHRWLIRRHKLFILDFVLFGYTLNRRILLKTMNMNLTACGPSSLFHSIFILSIIMIFLFVSSFFVNIVRFKVNVGFVMWAYIFSNLICRNETETFQKGTSSKP